MHRAFLGILVCILSVSRVPPMAAQSRWTCPQGFEGQTLNVYNWTTYIAPDTVPNFETACGVTVIYDVYESNEALLARIQQGNPGYDIIVPGDYVVAALAAQGMLEPLDKSLIPNFANLSAELTDPPYDPGNVYSVPYQWGTIGIGYNTEEVGREITSWRQMFEYDGPVAWLDEQRMMIGVALEMLGYNPNSTNPDEIAEARDYLAANGANVVAIAQDDGQAMLERGDVDIAVEWSGDIFQLMAEDATSKFAYVIPEEGANIWTDNLAIPLDAPNVPLAHAFIDYILDPQVGADISNFTAYGSPNQAAIDRGLIAPEYLHNPGIYPTDEIRARLFYVQDLPDAAQYYLDAWDELKILLGQ